jgi:hypothetical protein
MAVGRNFTQQPPRIPWTRKKTKPSSRVCFGIARTATSRSELGKNSSCGQSPNLHILFTFCLYLLQTVPFSNKTRHNGAPQQARCRFLPARGALRAHGRGRFASQPGAVCCPQVQQDEQEQERRRQRWSAG